MLFCIFCLKVTLSPCPVSICLTAERDNLTPLILAFVDKLLCLVCHWSQCFVKNYFPFSFPVQWCVLNLIPITCHDQQGSKTSVLAPTGHQPSWLVAQWVGKAMCWFSLPSCPMSICLCTYLLSDQALLLLCGILRFDYRPPSHAHLQSLYEKFI